MPQGRKGNKRSRQEERRRKHVEAEQKRRADIANALDELGHLLQCPGAKQAIILSRAVTTLRNLRASVTGFAEKAGLAEQDLLHPSHGQRRPSSAARKRRGSDGAATSGPSQSTRSDSGSDWAESRKDPQSAAHSTSKKRRKMPVRAARGRALEDVGDFLDHDGAGSPEDGTVGSGDHTNGVNGTATAPPVGDAPKGSLRLAVGQGSALPGFLPTSLTAAVRPPGGPCNGSSLPMDFTAFLQARSRSLPVTGPGVLPGAGMLPLGAVAAQIPVFPFPWSRPPATSTAPASAPGALPTGFSLAMQNHAGFPWAPGPALVGQTVGSSVMDTRSDSTTITPSPPVTMPVHNMMGAPGPTHAQGQPAGHPVFTGLVASSLGSASVPGSGTAAGRYTRSQHPGFSSSQLW